MRDLHIIMACVLLGVASSADRWVWSSSGRSGGKGKSRRIPGFVPTTPPPPITTFRPSLPFGVGRSATPSIFHPSFFPEGFIPFQFLSPDVPKVNEDGTTKSRVVADTAAALDLSSGASLIANDKYTTLDRLQRERGPAPAIPPPKRHQLGGLHPDEVFYADDDLLIIRGGGFHSDAFQEPLQPLDEGEDFDESSRVTSALPPPSSDQEYNGNIPSILPPPKDTNERIPVVLPEQTKTSPFSIFVGGSSKNDYILVPFVEGLQSGKPGNNVEVFAHNHLNANENQSSSKLRRAASSVVSYVYPTPANTYVLHQAQGNQHAVQPQRIFQNHAPVQLHQPFARPVVQSHRIIPSHFVVQHHAVHQRPVVHHQQTVVNQAPVHQQHTAVRQPLVHPEPLIQQQRPAVTNHFQVPAYSVTQGRPVLLPTPTNDYSDLELQPEIHRPVLSFEGDTRVNFLPPFPSRNPEAETFVPFSNRPTYIHTGRRTQRPIV